MFFFFCFFFNTSDALLINCLLSWIPSAWWSDLICQLPGETSVWRSQTQYEHSKCGLHWSKSTKKNTHKMIWSVCGLFSCKQRLRAGECIDRDVHPRLPRDEMTSGVWMDASLMPDSGRTMLLGRGGEMTSCQMHGCHFSGGGPPWMAKRVSYINHAASFHCDNHVCQSEREKKKKTNKQVSWKIIASQVQIDFW